MSSFEALLKEFTADMSAAEYANFDENLQMSEPMVNEFEINWRQRVREECIQNVFRIKETIVISSKKFLMMI